jgi:eukaryotic-like serine/threonine-protein kinase
MANRIFILPDKFFQILLSNKTKKMLSRIFLSLLAIIFFFLSSLISCSPGGSPNPPPPILSGEKKINSFVFTKANNALLTTDVTGSITGTDIKIDLPAGTSITSLTPTINFTGKSITPPSGTIQNFSVPVLYEVIAEDGTKVTYRVTVNTQLISETLYIGARNGNNTNGTVYAFDPGSGAVKWKLTATSVNLTSSIEFWNGILYCGIGFNLTAIDTATRKIKWEFPTGASIYSTPTVSNGIVYINSDDGNFYAINALTGSLVWKYLQNGFPVGPGNGGNYSSPTVVNGVLYAGSIDGFLYAINAATGVLKWKYTNGIGEIKSSPSVVNDVVYICDDFLYLTALNANDGIEKWRYSVGASTSSPTVVNGVIYVGSLGGGVHAIDIAGQRVWARSISGGINFGSPAVANGVVYMAQDVSQAYIFALDAQTGATKWMYRSDYSIASSPVVYNEVVYIGSYSDMLALNANTGTLKWKYVSPVRGDEFGASPCIVDKLGNIHLSSISGSKN